MKYRHEISDGRRQRGVALVVALLFLLVVTVISVIAASNSSLSLKMSANMADSYASLQAAEAGVIAVLSLAGTGSTTDPFNGSDNLEPFGSFDPNSSNHPLANLNDGPDSVNVRVFSTGRDLVCPRNGAGLDSSVGKFSCDYYRIAAEHEVENKARTKVQLGVVKTLMGHGS